MILFEIYESLKGHILNELCVSFKLCRSTVSLKTNL